MHAFPRDHYNSSTSDLFIHYYQTVQGSTNRDRIRGDFGKQTMTSYHRTIHFRCHWTHLLPMKTFYFSFIFLHKHGYMDRADPFWSTHRTLQSVWTWNSLGTTRNCLCMTIALVIILLSVLRWCMSILWFV